MDHANRIAMGFFCRQGPLGFDLGELVPRKKNVLKTVAGVLE